MRKEEVDIENIQNSQERTEDYVNKNPQEILENIEKNTSKEGMVLRETEDRVNRGDANFQKENAKSGILTLLGEKIKKNKLLRAALVGLSLYSANPAFASGLDNALHESISISSEKSYQVKDSELADSLYKLSNISDLRKAELVEVYEKAPEQAKKIILDELENGAGVSDENILKSSSNEDPGLLVIQQQIIDLQKSGEISPRRAGGVVLPFDKEHSGKSNDVEYSNNELADSENNQRITIENASENQIRSWVDYLKK